MAKKTYSTMIRMGAAHYDASIATSKDEVLNFNLRSMSRDERRQFHGAFMEAYRKSRRTRRNGKAELRRPQQRSS